MIARYGHSPQLRAARGFSMVEVMVTLIIIAVGMLGVAKLQALAMSSTGVAKLRSLAALEASSLAGAMRANRDYWSATPDSFTVNGAVLTDPTGQLAAAGNCNTGGTLPCTSKQMAAFDVNNWVTDINNVLPNPQVTVTCPLAVNPILCSIQISWTENVVAVNSQESAAAAANIAAATPAGVQTPTYTLYVQP
ncbi:MAG TPA: type IV pilus modification protein PilV [Steroidobacteraceae bacterium]